MDDATLNALVYRIVQRITAPLVTDKILTRHEAMAYCKCGSHAAFTVWARRWSVKPDARGRWSRARLDLALAREAGTTHTPAALRRTERNAA